MKIVYLHQYFVTPDEYGATRSYWFAKKLVERGHDVTIISALSSATKRSRGKYCIDGIKVIYVAGRYSNLDSIFKKLTHFLQYFFIALLQLGRQKNVDIVYASSTPLTVGVIALIIKKVKGLKYIFEVRDLWPEFPIQIGAIKNPLLIKLLRALEKSIYSNAVHIVALSPGMKEGVFKTGIPVHKMTVIPNMSKPDIFYPRDKSISVMKEFNIDPRKFNVIHFGSMGAANGLEYLIEAAKILKERENNEICFVLAGYGATEKKLKELVCDFHLENVIFTGKHNTYVISELVNCCDISLVSFRNLPILYTNSPNKLFDSLSAGKPIIVNSKGWTKDMVEENDCGFYVDPEDPNDLVNKLLSVKKDLVKLTKMGTSARILSIETFDKNLLSVKFANIIESFLPSNDN